VTRPHARALPLLAAGSQAIAGAILLLVLSSCGYFNTMYNAKRSFADAEKAAARGDRTTAEVAYRATIDKASRSVGKRPTSRWSDDARLLIARASIALGDYLTARRALLDLLDAEADADHRAAAEIYLGVIDAEMRDDANALARLDRALTQSEIDDDLAALARLTRARIYLERGDVANASRDLSAMKEQGSAAVRRSALLLDARLAIAANDSARTRRAFAALLDDAGAARSADSVRILGAAASRTFGHAKAQSFLEPLLTSAWPVSTRDSLLLQRAELSLLAGDTTAAITDLQRLTSRAAGGLADRARIRVAELQLASVRGTEDLAAARATLLSALGTESARGLIQSIKSLEIMMEKAAATGQPLQIFAAAEIARDELNAPRLASSLFLAYADVAPQTVWAPKALLAALALESGTAAAKIQKRLESYADNPYVSALMGGGDPDAFTAAEERLALGIQAARTEALAEAAQRENVVGRAVAVIDSVRTAARNDSTRVRCGILIDSLAVAGIRADSIRAACHRDDRARITALLKTDTLLLRDSTKAKADSLLRRLRRDTTRTK
jgi:hypothetical protein